MQPKRQRMELTREQHAPSNTEGDERFNSGAGASGNNYGYAQQGYYYQDAGHQQQHQYAEAGGYQSQAYQQQLAYAGMQAGQQQSYWYAAPFAEGANTQGAQTSGASQEVSVAMRDRDVKTQRRKEANRESARRSKQRKKEESELLSSKAQELVRESTSLRAELEKVQNQADKLYKENLELRSQVSKAGGTLPPAPPPVVPVKLPPPIELPASLFKEVVVSAGPGTAKKQESSDPASVTTTSGEGKTQKEKNGQGVQVKGAAPPAMSIKSEGMLQDEGIDLPSLLENELNNGENGGEHFAQAAMASNGGNSEGMLMSEAIVSFRESAGGTPSLFSHNSTLDELDLIGSALRTGPLSGKTRTVDEEELNFIRRTELGQGG